MTTGDEHFAASARLSQALDRYLAALDELADAEWAFHAELAKSRSMLRLADLAQPDPFAVER